MFDKIITLKLWILVSAVIGTGLIASLSTYTVVHLTQTKVTSPLICQPCPPCIQNDTPAPRQVSHDKFWDYKPLSVRGGKSY